MEPDPDEHGDGRNGGRGGPGVGAAVALICLGAAVASVYWVIYLVLIR